jgi:DNA-directed RNA polymerase subunit alpha
MEKSITLMITQLKAIVGWKEEEIVVEEKVEKSVAEDEKKETAEEKPSVDVEFLKTRIDDIGLSIRTVKALTNANVRTVGGLARKKELDILDIDGLGSKGIQEIKKVLAQYGISLK